MKKFLTLGPILFLISLLWVFFGFQGGPRTAVDPVVCPGMPWLRGHVEVFFDQDALRMVEQALAEARLSIDMEMYLLGGSYGSRILKLLDDQARRGVRVRLIHSFGRSLQWAAWLKKRLPESFVVNNREHPDRQPHYLPVAERLFTTELAESGIQRAEFPLDRFPADGWNPLRSPHDKLIVVDEKTAIVGGMNLATAVARNHDLLIRVTGPAVRSAVEVFDYDWRLATTGEAEFPGVDAARPPRQAPRGGDAMLRFLVTRPHCESQYANILGAIDQARQRVWVQMYCLTDSGIIDRLIAARRRGVDVRLLLDSNQYSLGLRLRGAPNLAFCEKLLANGVSVRIYRSRPGHQMHQKSMLVDHDMVMVGATNFTRQSFRVNTESMFEIRSPGVADVFEQRFAGDWNFQSDPPDPETLYSHRLYHVLARWVSRYI